MIRGLHLGLRLGAVLFAFACVLVIDWQTGPWISASIFYLVPVLLAVAAFGRIAGATVSVLSAIAWFMVDLESLPLDRALAISAWNAVMRLGFFILVGLMAAELLDRVDREKARADTDILTGLPNRRAFDDRLRQEADRAARYRRALALIYIDLDNFKGVNDSRGHAEGDRVLEAVAAVLRGHLRSVDLGARLGGDEFGILLPETDEPGAEAFVQSFQRTLGQAMQAGGWPVGASIGMVLFDRVPEDIRDMLHVADEAMYAAKKAGKDRVVRRHWPAVESLQADVGHQPPK